jgi:hypothetical protein
MTHRLDWATEAWARVCVDDARTRFLDKLYVQDGRDQPEHPLHSLYTGLYQQYIEELEKGD